MINKYGARVSPFSTPARMLNNSVSSSGHSIFAFVLPHRHNCAFYNNQMSIHRQIKNEKFMSNNVSHNK